MAFDFNVVIRVLDNPPGKTVAFANLIIDEQVEVSGFKIINGSKGLFVAAPNHKGSKPDEEGNAIYYDDVRFLGDREEGKFRTDLQNQIYQVMLDRYNEMANTSTRGQAASAQATSGNGSVANQSARLW